MKYGEDVDALGVRAVQHAMGKPCERPAAHVIAKYLHGVWLFRQPRDRFLHRGQKPVAQRWQDRRLVALLSSYIRLRLTRIADDHQG